MPLVSTDAIVLQSFAYSETSKILRLLTSGQGVQSVIAKGAMRPRSRFGGLLEPFSVGQATFYFKDGRDLHTLSAFEVSRSGQVLGRDLIRFAAASLIAEILMRAAVSEADPGLFDQVRGSLERLGAAEGDTLEPVALAETWGLVARLGFSPSLGTCCVCDRRLNDEEDTVFDHSAGGVRCTGCGGGGRALPAHARHALAGFVRREAIAVARTAAHWTLLSRFLSWHLGEDGPLRSLGFLLDTVDRAT